jgi:hypothetical protein
MARRLKPTGIIFEKLAARAIKLYAAPEHDPEKWEAVFPREAFGPEIISNKEMGS